MNLSVKNKGFKYGFCESFSVNYFIFDCSDCSHYEYHVFFLDRTGRLQSLFVFYDIASYTATDIITLGSAPSSSQTGCIGCRIEITLSAGALTVGNVINAFQYSIPATGIWFLSYSLMATATAAAVNMTVFQTYIQNNSGGTQYGISSNMATQPYVANGQYYSSNTGSAIVFCTLNDIWAVKYFISAAAANSVGTSTFNLVRIA